MSVEKMNFFQQFFSSISGSYRGLTQQNFRRALGYMVIVGIIFGSVHAGKLFVEGQRSVRVMAKEFADKSPDFIFANGLLTVEGEMPIVMQGGNSIIVIDTSGETDPSVLDDYEKGILIEKERLINKRNRFTKQEVLFSEFKDFSFTKKDVLRAMPWLDAIIGFIAVLSIIVFILGKLVYALFLSLAGLILNSVYKARLPFEKLLAICIYALTFSIILLTVKIFIPGGIPFFGLFYFVLALVYVWIGVRASIPNDVGSESLIPPTDITLSE